MLGWQARFVCAAILLVGLIHQQLRFGSFHGGAVPFHVLVSPVVFCLLRSGMDGGRRRRSCRCPGCSGSGIPFAWSVLSVPLRDRPESRHVRPGRFRWFSARGFGAPVSRRIRRMSDALFEIDDPAMPTLPRDMPIRPEQLHQIRDAFDEAGVLGQEDRKALIESVVIRPMSALRDLSAIDARRVLQRIKELTDRSPKASGSAWETREEDTWIDKM